MIFFSLFCSNKKRNVARCATNTYKNCNQKCYLITFYILFFKGLGFYARPDYNINICERMKNIEYKIKNIEFLGVEAEYEVDDNEEPKKLLVVSLVIIIVGSKKLVQFFFRLASTVPMENRPGTF